MEEKLPIISFDDSCKENIFEALGLTQEEGNLIDEDGLIQINSQFEEVSSEEFGGILKGSKRIIKKDSSEILSYFAEKI